MKSTFAKFVDRTLGAILVFLAATAILRYYTTLDYAAFSAGAVTICVLIIARFVGKRKSDALVISDAAAEMFFDFMFLDESAPAKLLFRGLKQIDGKTTMRGKLVYVGNTAAFCAFDAQVSAKSIARAVAKAKHFGANKLVVFMKAPAPVAEVEDFTVKCVNADDTYKLFASLGALPEKRFSKRKRSRLAAFKRALGKDKIAKYLLLSASMFAVTLFIGFSIVTFICACIAATLFLASCIFTAVNAAKSKRKIKN